MKLKLSVNIRCVDDDATLEDLALASSSGDGIAIRTAHGQVFADLTDIERIE